MKHLILLSSSLALILSACSSTPRVLSVKSEPADAEVCIKGKYKSEYFSQTKNCIGTTPLEIDQVSVTDENGKKRTIELKDVADANEPFYLIVSRPGYAPQSVQVPAWEHFIALRSEQKDMPAAAPAPVANAAPAAVKGQAKISSNPIGALVYVNDFLRGNTPYVIESDAGQSVRLKIEQSGYRPIERSITLEPGKTMEINLSMEKDVLAQTQDDDREPASGQMP